MFKKKLNTNRKPWQTFFSILEQMRKSRESKPRRGSRQHRKRKSRKSGNKRFFAHVKDYRQENPELPFKSILHNARRTFKPRGKSK